MRHRVLIAAEKRLEVLIQFELPGSTQLAAKLCKRLLEQRQGPVPVVNLFRGQFVPGLVAIAGFAGLEVGGDGSLTAAPLSRAGTTPFLGQEVIERHQKK